MRRWVRQDEVDRGQRPGVTTEENEEIKRLGQFPAARGGQRDPAPGTATIWISEATVQGDTTTVDNATGDVSFNLHPVQQGNDWKVDSYHDGFLPGSGP